MPDQFYKVDGFNVLLPTTTSLTVAGSETVTTSDIGYNLVAPNASMAFVGSTGDYVGAWKAGDTIQAVNTNYQAIADRASDFTLSLRGTNTNMSVFDWGKDATLTTNEATSITSDAHGGSYLSGAGMSVHFIGATLAASQVHLTH